MAAPPPVVPFLGVGPNLELECRKLAWETAAHAALRNQLNNAVRLQVDNLYERLGVARRNHLNQNANAFFQTLLDNQIFQPLAVLLGLNRRNNADLFPKTRAADKIKECLIRTLHRLINDRVCRALVLPAPPAGVVGLPDAAINAQNVAVRRRVAAQWLLHNSHRNMWTMAALQFAMNGLLGDAAQLVAMVNAFP